MATIYKENGKQIEVTPKNGKTFSLKELQEIVGGYIEITYISTDEGERLMVLNEEGKLIGLHTNYEATELYNKNRESFDVIAGDVLVCETNQID